MTPCERNRGPLALLAIDALEASRARNLREHIGACEGCREDPAQLTKVARTLAMQKEPELQASQFFHRRVVEAVRAESPPSLRATWLESLRQMRRYWRWAVPMLGAGALAIGLVAVWHWPHGSSAPDSQVKQIRPASSPTGDLAPSIANYQAVANRSLEELDELLSRQAERARPAPPLYTASLLTRRGLSD